MVAGMRGVVRMDPRPVRDEGVEGVEQINAGTGIEVGRGDGSCAVQHRYRSKTTLAGWDFGLDLVGNVDDLAFALRAEMDTHEANIRNLRNTAGRSGPV